jgi:hypothetical protein
LRELWGADGAKTSYDVRAPPEGSFEEWASRVCALIAKGCRQDRFFNSLE